MSRLCVIDGDLLSYLCAAATEKRSVIATHKETLDEFEFNTVTLFREWAEGDGESYSVKATQYPEPISHTIRAMKGVLTSILTKTQCDNYHIVLSGDNNFRKNIPLPTQYKNNRKEMATPVNLKEAKQYLLEKHDAELAVGEADEVLVAYAYQGYVSKEVVIQASIDKDANVGPGWLFNWNEMQEPELIEGLGGLYEAPNGTIKGKGRMFLFHQMCFGDPADCYKPCEIAKVRFGEKSSYKLLKDCRTDKECLEVLVAQYKKWYPEPTYYTAWDGSRHKKTWMEIWQMYADCAWMPRWDGDRFDVEKVLNKLKVSY